MKKNHLWIVSGATLLFLAGGLSALATWLLSGRESEWTTRSKAALEELRKGIDASQRGYGRAAIEHLDRALELDSKAVAPRLYLTRQYTPIQREYQDLVAELGEAGPEHLNHREELLVRYFVSESRGDNAAADAALAELLAAYPEDFLGLDILCRKAWIDQDWEEAEDCYYSMVEIHPNFVEAYNRLGYIDMAQGRFTEAEEHFRTHRFIAPDQEQSYSSLAELMILLGRYEEATELLDRALEIDPDSCWPLVQLLRTDNFSGRFADSRQVIGHLERVPACAAYADGGFFCYARGLVDFLEGRFEDSWARFDEECLERRGGFDLIGHHVAVATGRPEAAEAMQERLRQRLDEVREGESAWTLDWFRSLDAHFEGVQRLAAGDYGESSRLLREADERLRYWTHERAGFKLLNRTFLARSLALEGKQTEAKATLAKVEAVNPRFPGHLPVLPFLEPRRR